MLDFLMVSTRHVKGNTEIYPKFCLKTSTDLMTRGGDFYAIWDEERGLWSTSRDTACFLIDQELDRYADEYRSKHPDEMVKVLHMWDSDSGSMDKWIKFVQKQMWQNYHELDERLIFSNTVTTKADYASKRLGYPFERLPIPAYEELVSTLYDPIEREKLEWAIGAIISGDSKNIQKFVVMYGAPKTGKSTVLNIMQDLFDGYWCSFDAKTLGSTSNAFALEAFRSNPLVAIQHDGDLSRIEDNTRLNSLVSHETMLVNEKHKSTYNSRFNTFLFMGTNKPVKITDAKSGIIRRLIDISPSGKRIPAARYRELVSQIKFELGGIAAHCLDIYQACPNRYDDYVPITMLGTSNNFYNYVLDSFDTFKRDDGVTLKQAWELYKVYNEEANVAYGYSQMLFKEELKSYFREFYERTTLDNGTRVWNYYSGFLTDKFDSHLTDPVAGLSQQELDIFPMNAKTSILDEVLADCPAQYASPTEAPLKRWSEVKTSLKDISTNLLHYVNPPEEMNLIVVDFDLKDDDGNKCFKKNAEAARLWPATYAELSKGGQGIHLHYFYSGDTSKLKALYSPNIEVKIFNGGSSLRRRLTRCNDIPIATIASGLPLKEERPTIDWKGFKNQKQLMASIARNLRKENAPHATKPSIDYIYNDLEAAYASGIEYDVTSMRPAIMSFAAKSTHNANYCLQRITQMKFQSENLSDNKEFTDKFPIVFFDVEVYSNLFVVVYKEHHGKKISLVNPGPAEMEQLFHMKLVGFNNRDYDNHIIYARHLGYTNADLFELSKRIISGSKNAKFGGAYNLSYTDIYDFAAKKQSLKKWEIFLGIHHMEMDIPWDQPVPEERIGDVVKYCGNDVDATEALFDYLVGDWTARQILADISGMTVNDTTNSMTTRLIFGRERHPELVYTDLATGEQFGPADQCKQDLSNAFPGYFFGTWADYYRQYPEYLPEGKRPEDYIQDGSNRNLYRGTDLGKGGYVYAEPGIWEMLALLDVASLHPHSIKAMNCFGKYTENFVNLMNARLYIKHKDYESAKQLFGGKLAKYLDDPKIAKQLSQALKIAINSVYGLTSAAFENPFRDIRNTNNIVALRGALFMRTLQDEVVKRGFQVAHIKTDSIKIPKATQEIIDFCMEFARGYGYEFEHEATYEKMCLVNDAVYIAKYVDDGGDHTFELPSGEKVHTLWTATGTQFQVPYVFKTLFSHDPITFRDMCETKSVKTSLYLDLNEGLPDTSTAESIQIWRMTSLEKLTKKAQKVLADWSDIPDDEVQAEIDAGHRYHFVGRVGQFCPIKEGFGGGELVATRELPNGGVRYDAVQGTKGYRWLESEMVKTLEKEATIDESYYEALAEKAKSAVAQYGDYEWFVA